MHDVELLAPAGNAAALHAAVCAGADAVYMGLEVFNARRGAQNFTVETLSNACDYAHMRGVNIYVTLNTVVLPDEVSSALECARQAFRAGADAFIVQDIGLAAELARTLPEARLHISTQMNTHNADGIRAVARLGAQRVTLARELSLSEITLLADVAAEEGLEVEAFAHGALCVCYSGQCFMSSMIGGRSANRGMCAQACRLPYTLHNRALSKNLPSSGDHLLSPQDLCTVDVLPELVVTGVASLKIEGRMKSPEYVYAVTSTYRAVLDRVLLGGEARVTSKQRRTLEEAFSRGFTTAYLEGRRGNEIMSYQRPNNRGVFVGRVVEVHPDKVLIAGDHDLREGDVLEFWTRKGHVAQTVSSLSRVGSGRVLIPLDKQARSVRKEDRVFRVRSAEAAFVDDPLEPRIELEGSARLVLGKPLQVTFSPSLHAQLVKRKPALGRCVGEAEGAVIEAARTKAVDAHEVREHIDRLGATPFSLAKLDIDLDAGVGIGFSQLHQVRAAALEDLSERILAPYRTRRLPRVTEREPQPVLPARGCHIAAWVTNPVCARAARRAGADLIYVPALNYKRGESVVAGQRSDTVEQAGYPKQCIPVMPAVYHDRDKEKIDTWHFVREGKPVLVENLGDIFRAKTCGAQCEVGPRVPVTNKLTLDFMAACGVSRVWLSPELTLANIAEIACNAPIALGLTIIGAQELMVCEHCLLMSQGPCDQHCAGCSRRKSPHYLKDRKGFEFPVITDMLGRSHLFNSVPLDNAHVLPDLMAAGISSYMVDTTLMNGEQTAQAVGRAVRALKIAQLDGNTVAKMSHATSGHLFRGVS